MLPALFMAGACTRDLVFDFESDPVLLISPAVVDGQDFTLRTRALGEEDLKDTEFYENVVNRLDVFFFEGTTLKKDYHLDADDLTEVTRGGKTGFLLSSDWIKDGLEKDTEYLVYVIANSTSETIQASPATISAPADLEALTRTEADIYKRQKNDVASDDVTFTPTKSFLMTKVVPSWTISSYATQLVNDSKVYLERAAVKFVIDLSLSDEFQTRLAENNMQYGTPDWKYMHFNVMTYEVPNGQETAVEDLQYYVGTSANKYLGVEAAGEDGHYTIVTYAYPQTWTAETAGDKAPAVLLSFLGGPTTGNEGNEAYHYYYIPLCSSDITATSGNNLYKVHAVISSEGSSEAISSSKVNLTYEVLPWETDTEADINAVPMDYLMVTPTTYSFKGGVVGTPLTTQIKFYASGAVTLSGLTGEYKDKTGTWQTVTLGDNVFTATLNQTSGANEGTVDLNSWVPTNGTSRRVRFTLTCGDKSQDVIIVHYPLDFISSESGAYSTYQYDGWVTPGVSSSYAASNIYDGVFVFSEDDIITGGFLLSPSVNHGVFHSHIFGSDSIVYNLDADGTQGDQVNSTPLTNNQMYVLQLTSSNENYIIGRPTLTSNSESVYRRRNNGNLALLGTVTYYTSEDNVISPAFMLGSQLGVVGVFSSAKFAAMHCALYKENNGGTDYVGWRLPTKQEVQYMIDNQLNYGEAMDEVVGGRYYWTLDGGYAYNSEADGSGDGSSENGSKYVRCVRDVSAEEIETINAKLFEIE
ncbi:MAG: hypothetical protein K5910_09165 [Bacteroidales bacterium]|nr:hypothetical protein [Bacteroidales bacterium]